MKGSFELRCRTYPPSVEMVQEFIDQHLGGVEEDWISDLHVIADELASNIEKFAYRPGQGEYIVRMVITEESVDIIFEDDGREFDPTQVEEMALDGDPDRPVGNLGILLVRNLSDGLTYSRQAGRNITTVVKRLPCKEHEKGDD